MTLKIRSKLLSLVFIILFFAPQITLSTDKVKNVVVFFALSANLPSYQNFIEGLKSTISIGSKAPINLIVEYLDLGRSSDDFYAKHIINLYNSKFQETKIDLLITIGPLIDDDLSVRRGFELFFKSADMEYKSLESADDFLTRFNPVQGDLIILDLSLPGTSGCDLLKKVNEKGVHVPVVVVTSLDDPISRETCQKYGVKAFLRKPVDGEALMDIIKYHLI